jgi:mannosyltransferase OCH1-like enzyme
MVNIMDVSFLEKKINENFALYGNIEKIIHVTWKNKEVINKNYNIIKNGICQLKNLNPDYQFIMYDDQDIDKYLQEKLEKLDYDLIKNKKIVEKTDLWRLLKLYYEGGVYQDIDRFCNIPLSNIIKPTTKCVLPMYLEADFSQDIMISCSKNEFHKRAIELNLERRRHGHTDIYYLGPVTYFNAITEIILGVQLNREPGEEMISLLRTIINNTPYLETYREEPMYNTILYRGNEIYNDKDELYKDEGVTHWIHS